MSSFTVEQLEEGIASALKAGDLDAVASLVRAMVALDPARAQVVFDALELGVALARRRSTDGNGKDAED